MLLTFALSLFVGIGVFAIIAFSYSAFQNRRDRLFAALGTEYGLSRKSALDSTLLPAGTLLLRALEGSIVSASLIPRH